MTSYANHILVADDDAAVRAVLGNILREDGCDVVEAADGSEALALFQEEPCRVVVTDIRMPRMDGMTLLEKIRGIDERTRVIVMTGHASTDTSIRALKLGAYDYLLKPFDNFQHVAQVVRRAQETVQLAEERDLLVASLKRKNRELAHLNKVFRELAIRDGLTGIHNHRFVQEKLKEEVSRARRYGRELALLFIDVDHFKHFNDTHGHPQGDEVLKQLAQLLDDNTRSVDTVARWGGEEFVILAPETNLENARRVAELIRERVAAYDFRGDGQPGGHVTISAGCAVLADDGDDRQLVHDADEALYAAKSDGRNCVRTARSASHPAERIEA